MNSIQSLLRPEHSDRIWSLLQHQATTVLEKEPALAGLIQPAILNCDSFSDALKYILVRKLEAPGVDALILHEVFTQSHTADPAIVIAAEYDLVAIIERDPAAHKILEPFLYYKGFHALQSHRVAHWLWNNDRKDLALYLQSQSSSRFGVDIHPAAPIGRGVMMDHATGIVIGETSVIEDNVSLLHGVTLGGTSKENNDRHPKIRAGVMIGAGAKILGNIEIGEHARVAAGSVVLEAVPPHTTVAGIPAKIICKSSADQMDQVSWLKEAGQVKTLSTPS